MKSKDFVLEFTYDLRTKLLLLFCANVLIFLGKSIRYGFLLCLVFTGIVASSGCGKTAIKFISFFLFSSIIEKILLSLSGQFFLTLMLFVLAIIRKFLPCLIIGKWIMNSTTPAMAVATLQKVGLNQDALIMISVIFRCFPTIKDEWKHIIMAMKTRGISFTIQNLVNHFAKTMEYFFIPFYVSVLEISDELSQSAIVRGIDAPVRKTSRYLIKFRFNDYLAIIFTIAVLFFVIYLKSAGTIL